MKFKVTGNQTEENRTYHDFPLGQVVEATTLEEHPQLQLETIPEGYQLIKGDREGYETLELIETAHLEEAPEEPTESE